MSTRPPARRLARAVLGPAVLAVLATTLGAGPAVGGTPTDVIQLPDGFETEGVTSAPDGTFYATSLVGRGIWTGNLRDGTSERFVRLPWTSLRGTLVHPRTGNVWAVGSRGDQGIAIVLDPRQPTPSSVRSSCPVPVSPTTSPSPAARHG